MSNTPPSNAAIHYDADGYRFDKKIMGRQSAGMGFLKTLCQHGNLQELVGWCNNPQAAKDFVEDVAMYGHEDLQSTVIGAANIERMCDIGTLYTPSPDLTHLAWQRSRVGTQSWSLCGVTHTTCSTSVMDSIVSYLSAPVEPWDALVCTSQAAKAVVTRLLDRQQAYLAQSIGAQTFTRPQLPVIPLGVECQSFNFSEGQRQQARAALNIKKDDLVVLYAGRLSFHAKAHPLPMYTALEALSDKYDIHIVHFGVFSNTGLEQAFKAGALALCPNITCHWLDGSVDENHGLAWQSADVFCSLADNIQETFGLTPIEAMAAGLPVVVSDWNGYKDTVRHKIDGFRVKTVMPAPELGVGLAQRHHFGVDNFDYYIGHTSQFVGVDVEECKSAFDALFSAPDLRYKMGQSGQKRAIDVYDWPVVIKQYQNLWRQLGELRKAHTTGAKLTLDPPARPCPFSLYQSYPSFSLGAETSVHINCTVSKSALHTRRNLDMINFAKAILPSEADCMVVLNALGSQQEDISLDRLTQLTGATDEKKAANLMLIIAWFHKQGWVSLEDVHHSS